ncbi:hypothetical protein [Agromyces sp. NPDC057865]|uniref:hypothetical protein n=1 Tax=Agromyces sp. NPDC057865 TaxID=3346267 RepID=UPI003672B63E
MTRTALRAARCAPALLVALALAACTAPAAPVARDTATAASVDWSVIESEVQRDLQAVDAFWAESYVESYAGEFRSPWNVWSFDSAQQDAPVMCAGELIPSDNAVFCLADDSVVWDEQLMRPAWAAGEGPLAAIVAHEWGHVVQFQTGFTGHWTALELQADCFAGAALAGLAASDQMTWDDAELERAADALASHGDPEPWTAPGDHGDAAERGEAFRVGLEGGVPACATDPRGRGAEAPAGAG